MIAELLDPIARRLVRRLSGAEAPDQWLIDWVRGGEETASGEFINEENALTVPVLKAAVTVLAEAMQILSLIVLRREKSGRVSVVTDHPVLEIFNRAANPETAAPTWKNSSQIQLGLWGNTYSAINRLGSGDPIALWNLSPRPDRTAPFRNVKDGTIWYTIRNQYGQEEDPLPASEVFHVPYFSLDGLTGKSPVKLARESIGGIKAAARFGAETFKNDGAQSGHYTHPGKLGESAHARLKKSFEEYSEHGQRHKKLILEEGMKFEPAGSDPAKMQMLESRRFGIIEIAQVYRITPHLLQDLTNGSVANVAALGREFVTYTMSAWMSLWCGQINFKLLKPPYFAAFDDKAFLRGDPAAMSAYYRTMFSIGYYSLNEIREEEGEAPINDPNADEHFVPLNMVPLSKATDPEWVKGKIGGGANQEPRPGGVHPGDGESPSDPGTEEQPLPKQQAAEERKEMLAAAVAIFSSACTRIAALERNEAVRASKDPSTFLTRMDAFYPKHERRLREVWEMPIRAVKAAGGDILDLDAMVAAHLAGLRNKILLAAECPADWLEERVADALAIRDGN
jgi:HK97 family phage portal protein